MEDERTFRYQPETGEAWIFNTRNPREVSAIGASDRDRRAVACFVGRMPAGRLAPWS